jgi:hypothetical protein
MSDRYEIRDKIGQGGVGAVYKAFDTQLKREVALKRLLPAEESVADANSAQAFTDDLLKEATTLSSLQHPNIVTIYDVGTDEHGPFVVMELLRGETFDETIGRGALPLEDFKKVVTQSLEALIAAHDSGIVHRDLKPGNIMVIWLPSGKFQIKILDFGLAKFGKLPSKQTADQEDGILGSIYFMAPEQFERIGLDARTDMYALGSIFYYALTGKYPFQGDNAPQVMAAHLQHRVTPLDSLRPDIPQWLANWVMWLISREMKDRPIDAKQAFDFYNREQSGLQPAGPALATGNGTIAIKKKAVAVAIPQPARAPTRLLVTGGGASAGAKTKSLAASAAVAPAAIPVGQITSQVSGGQQTQSIPGQTPQQARPAFVPPKKAFPIPKWAMITVPVLAFLIGLVWFIKTGKRDLTRDYYKELVALTDAETPTGDAATVAMLVNLVEEGGNNAIAGLQVLERLQGDDVEKAILSQLHKVRSELGKEGLIGVITQRKIKGSIPDIARYLDEKYPKKVREAAIFSIGVLGTESDLIDLMKQLQTTTDERSRDILEGAIVNLTMINKDENNRTVRIRRELQGTTGPYRLSLLHILAQLGGDRAWRELENVLKKGSDDEKKAVLKGLASWSNFTPGPLLAEIISETKDNSIRLFAVRAYSSLLSRPSATPAGEKIASIRKVLEAVSNRKDKEELLGVASRIIDPSSLALMREYESDPKLGQTAKYVANLLAESLKKVVEIAGDTTFPASTAILESEESADLEYDKTANAIIGWNRPYYSVTWPVNVTQPGKYAISVLQASKQDEEQTFSVSLAGATLTKNVLETDSESDFKTVEMGEIDIVQPGGYKLSVQPEKAVEYGDIMALREVTLKRIGDVTPKKEGE